MLVQTCWLSTWQQLIFARKHFFLFVYAIWRIQMNSTADVLAGPVPISQWANGLNVDLLLILKPEWGKLAFCDLWGCPCCIWERLEHEHACVCYVANHCLCSCHWICSARCSVIPRSLGIWSRLAFTFIASRMTYIYLIYTTKILGPSSGRAGIWTWNLLISKEMAYTLCFHHLYL